MSTDLIIFMAASDTIAASFLPVIRQLDKMKNSNYVVCLPPLTTENADKFFADAGVATITWHQAIARIKSQQHRPILILGNDWSKEARYLIKKMRNLNGSSVCIQESVIDFADQQLLRMRHADYVVLQGDASFLAAGRNDAAVLGNPRYENNVSWPEKDNVILVNCNFTYGVEADKRDAWLGAVVDALKKYNKNYLIIQHPRDNTDISKFGPTTKTNVKIVSNYLKTASLLITRYSSLLHESVSLGTPAIYFNPFNEQMGYDFSYGNSDVVTIAKSKEELCILLAKQATLSKEDWETKLRDYKKAHFRPHVTLPSILIAEHLINLPIDKATNSEPATMVDELGFIARRLKRMARIYLTKK